MYLHRFHFVKSVWLVRSIYSLLIALLFVTVLSGTLSAATTNVFSGVLRDQTGAPITNGQIVLRDASGNSFLGGSTSSGGAFSLAVQPGMYSLEIRGGMSTDIQDYTISQDINNPTIDLTTSNVSQDITLQFATVNINLYNPQGYYRSGSVTGISGNVAGSAVSLYPGGPDATNVYIQSKPKNTSGTATFKTLVGAKFTGASSTTGICGYARTTGGGTLIGCNQTPFTAANGTNTVDLPNTPAPRNTFSGVLRDQTGSPITNGQIVLRDAYGNSVLGDSTSNGGSFSLAVQPGMYSLEIRGGMSTDIQDYTISQDINNPTIDLTTSSVGQDITLQFATVNINLYNAQGYYRSGNVRGVSGNVSGSSVSLYPGGPDATNVYIQSKTKNTSGAATFKTLVGAKFTGASSTTGICGYTGTTGGGTLIGCNQTPFTAVAGSNVVDLPNTPAPNNTFSGTLKDQNGSPFGGLTVNLRDAYGNSILGYANSAGEFSVPVRPGVYSLGLYGGPYGEIQSFSISQDINNPTIDLTQGNVSHNITLDVATVSVSLYNEQGYVRSGYISGKSQGISGSSVSLYPGGTPATTVSITSKGKNTLGTATFQTFAGVRYTGANQDSGICGLTSSYSYGTLIGCNPTELIATSGTNNVNLPNTPAPRNTFSGTLKDQNGVPFNGVDIRLRDAFGNQVYGSTASDGSFSIAVQPGMYAVFLNGSESNGMTFTISQSTINPGIDLRTGNVTQNITLPTATVNIKLYDAQGNPRSGYVLARTYANASSAIPLYVGGAPATDVNISTSLNVGTAGADIKTFVGTVYGTSTNDKICTYTSSSMTTLIGCNASAFKVEGDGNGLAFPKPNAPLLLTSASPTSNPILSWQAVPYTSKYFVYRDGLKIGDSTETTFADNNVTSGTYNYQVSSLDKAGNESSLSVVSTVTVVQGAPILDTPTLTKNPIVKGEVVTASVRVLGNLYGVTGGEYFIGSIDPGAGNGVSVDYSAGSLVATINNLNAGSYTLNFRAHNNVGWGQTVSVAVTVTLPSFSGVLKDQNGTALPGVTLTLKDASNNTLTGVTASSGSFSISVQPGKYSLGLSGGTSSNAYGVAFNIAQSTANPSIDLRTGNVIQNLVLKFAQVDFTVYNAQGYAIPNGKLIAGSTTGAGGDISLYDGGVSATQNQVTTSGYKSTNAQGKGSFYSIVGTRYLGTNTSNGLCGFTTGLVQTGCNETPFTVAEGTNTIDIPKTPVQKKTFSGALKDQNGVGLVGATITLRDAFSNIVTGTTSAGGAFSVAVQPGMYSLGVNGGVTTNAYDVSYNLAQPTTNPSIDLTNNVAQDLSIEFARIDYTVYNAQGYTMPSGKLTAAAPTSSASEVILYPGGVPATVSQAGTSGYKTANAQGQGSFYSIVGIRYAGVSSSNGLCAFTTGLSQTGCNNTPLTVQSGINTVDIPKTPVPKNTLSGSLRDQSGAGMVGATVGLRDAYNNYVSSVTGVGGVFSLAVQPGMYYMSLTGGTSTNNYNVGYNLSQSSSSPSIDITLGNVSQDLTLEFARVDYTLYNAQGYELPSGKLVGRADGSNGSVGGISLYPGGVPATTNIVTINGNPTANAQGQGSIYTLVGTKFLGTSTNNGLCALTSQGSQTGCNNTQLVVQSGVNTIDIPKAPLAKNVFSGALKDQSGNAMVGATVGLRDAYNNYVSSVTGAGGMFSLAVRPGMYYLSLAGGTSTNNYNVGYNLSQSPTNPSVNLTAGALSQDLTLEFAEVQYVLYDTSGNVLPNGRLVGRSDVISGSSISLYSGGSLATYGNIVTVNGNPTANALGRGSFYTLVGTKFLGTNTNNGLCALTSQGSQTGCNNAIFTVASGTNTIDIPKAPTP